MTSPEQAAIKQAASILEDLRVYRVWRFPREQRWQFAKKALSVTHHMACPHCFWLLYAMVDVPLHVRQLATAGSSAASPEVRLRARALDQAADHDRFASAA